MTKTQISRAARLFVATFLTTLTATGTEPTKAAMISAAVAAVEVTWRYFFPAQPEPRS